MFWVRLGECGRGTKKLKTKNSKLGIVIAAAGESRRFGSDKLAAPLGGRTVLECAVEALRRAVPGVPIVVVVASDRVDHWRVVLESQHSNLDVIAGGSRRQDSVRLGVEKVAERAVEIVAVHDGARPLVHPEDVRRVFDALGGWEAAILCSSVSDTVKRVDNRNVVAETIDRISLRMAQTPQVFRVSALESAWATKDAVVEFSDEAALLESSGFEVRCVLAEHPNPKLTTVDDEVVVRILEGGAP